MTDENLSFANFLQDDDRYPIDAYEFVRQGLNYAVEVLQLGQNGNVCAVDESDEAAAASAETALPLINRDSKESAEEDRDGNPDPGCERHLTGQQLCEALREFALHQYGLMAKVVLGNWGIHETSDFGEIVYNMIRAGWMKKSPRDRKDHFDNVYDFSEAFERQFEIGTSAIHWPG